MQRLGWFSLVGSSTEGRRFAEWLDSSGGWGLAALIGIGLAFIRSRAVSLNLAALARWVVGARKDQCADKKVQHVEARSQAHIKSSLPYDFPLGFYREGTILPVSVGAGLLPFRQGYCARRLAGHGCSPASTDTVQGLASQGPPLAYSQGAPTVYSPRSSPA